MTWREGVADASGEHFLFYYEEHNEPVARLARSDKATVCLVEFLPATSLAVDQLADAVAQVRGELDFYLVELREPDPWAYARYHANTAANIYSSVHWVLRPGSPALDG